MMNPCYFTMNWLRFLLACWSIFMLVEDAVSSKEAVLHRTTYRAPLAVIKKQDSSLKLAIPHAHQSENYLSAYNYDDSEEKFMIACPARDEKQSQVQKNWKVGASMTTDKSTLLFLSEYTDQEASCSLSDDADSFVPSINKVAENRDEYVAHCNQLQADMYEVGYPVSKDEEGKDIQFLSTYKICYSKTKGEEATLYSIHRIKSPDLLFSDVIIELPNYQPLMRMFHYDSVLDASLSTKDSFEGVVYYKYEFVGYQDMPSRQWQQTTSFLFNYTTIIRNTDLFKGMIRADWYIRLYSYRKNKPLNLYSGTSPSPLVDSFWRVISDDDGKAIILVTQNTRQECGHDYLCEKNRQVKKYKGGGCIYTCSLDENDDLLQKLSLPPIKITGGLDFTLQTNGIEVEIVGGQKRSYSLPTETVGIIRFLENIRSLGYALLSIDKDIFKNATYRDE